MTSKAVAIGVLLYQGTRATSVLLSGPRHSRSISFYFIHLFFKV